MPPAKSPSTRSERGFTLVEVVVAMLVCVVGLIGMAQMLAVTLRMQQLGRNSTSAVRMAQDKLDELSSMNFEEPVLWPSIQCGGSLTADVTNYNDVPVVNGQAQPYKRRWLVQAGPDADPQLRQVTVRVIPNIPDRGTSAPYELISVVRGAGVSVCP